MLHRRGRERRAVGHEVVAPMVHLCAGPERRDEPQCLVQSPRLGWWIHDLAERRQLTHPVVTEPHTEHQPASAQPVDSGALAGHHLRPATGQRRHEQTEAHPLRRHGDGRQAHPRIRHRQTRLPLDVVPQEDAVPAASLRLPGKISEDARVGQFPEGCDEESVVHGVNSAGGH